MFSVPTKVGQATVSTAPLASVFVLFFFVWLVKKREKRADVRLNV